LIGFTCEISLVVVGSVVVTFLVSIDFLGNSLNTGFVSVIHSCLSIRSLALFRSAALYAVFSSSVTLIQLLTVCLKYVHSLYILGHREYVITSLVGITTSGVSNISCCHVTIFVIVNGHSLYFSIRSLAFVTVSLIHLFIIL
jgi:hypothetical protein